MEHTIFQVEVDIARSRPRFYLVWLRRRLLDCNAISNDVRESLTHDRIGPYVDVADTGFECDDRSYGHGWMG